MDSSKLAVNTFLDKGIKKGELNNVLASNSVVDWFGRTIKGRQNIVNFFLNSNVIYEHSFSTVESTQAFEDRKSHMTTRQLPLEYLIGTSGTIEDSETSLESSSTPNEKGNDFTPTSNKTNTKITCPPAPNRNGFSSISYSDSEESNYSDDLDLSGVHPIDSTLIFDSPVSSPKKKKMRIERNNKRRSIPSEEQCSKDSLYTNLKYTKASGNVKLNRQDMEHSDERTCSMFLSYREKLSDKDDVQISLIVYKSNTQNIKSRRNLCYEFETKTIECHQQKISSASKIKKERQTTETITSLRF